MTPRGRLIRSRVVSDAGEAFSTALDRGLTGYARVEPQQTVLLDGDAAGVVALVDGVPTRAHHAETGRAGADAVADLSGPGPFRIALYECPEAASETEGAPIDPGLPADLLARDPAVAERTRAAAPADRPAPDAGGSADALEAFLDNEAKIEAIRERAREEAAERAAEWGLSDLAE